MGNGCSVTKLVAAADNLGQIVASEMGPRKELEFELPTVLLATELDDLDACGPLKRTLTNFDGLDEDYPWLALDETSTRIIVQNSKKGDAGIYSLKLET